MTGAQGLQRNSAECEGNERGVRFAGAGCEPCGSYESILRRGDGQAKHRRL